MFRKLVANLPFSPTLVEQVAFYAKRLRKEELTRRTGLIFTVLALIVQGLTVFMPVTSANTSHASDLISGGVTSKDQILTYYDNTSHDYKKIFDYVGITRDELTNATVENINSRDYGTGNEAWLSWGRVARFSSEQGEVTHTIDDATTVYSRPLWRADTTDWTTVHGSTYKALVGTSSIRGKFAILFLCGNLVTRTVPTPKKLVTVCRPGTGIITIDSSEKIATDLPSNSSECMPKNAQCQTVLVTKIDRTHYVFKASTEVSNASVSGYIFTIKDTSTGTVITTTTVTTNALEATTGTIEIKDPASYMVSVTVKTNAGDKTSPNCQASFTIAPPEKCEFNTGITKNDSECKPCEKNSTLWYKSVECNPVLILSKTALNLTQGTDATTVVAMPGDRIEYHLTVKNAGKVPAIASFSEQLDDVLEYTTLQDQGGGNFNTTSKILSWADTTIQPGQSQSHTLVVALPASITSTPQGQSDQMSYDCIMNNTFGDNTQIKVDCSPPKQVEQAMKALPRTGPTENLIFGGAILTITTFLWARSRQLGKEVRLVRKEFSSGGI